MEEGDSNFMFGEYVVPGVNIGLGTAVLVGGVLMLVCFVFSGNGVWVNLGDHYSILGAGASMLGLGVDGTTCSSSFRCLDMYAPSSPPAID